MAKNIDTAWAFFEACETGKGWEACKDYCHEGATFSAQTGALAELNTVEGYADWMRDLFIPIPDAHYDLKCFAEDEERECVAAVAVFLGTQTGPGGPGEPTGKSIAADYVYSMEFENGKIKHLTKVWNDHFSMQQLGWA